MNINVLVIFVAVKNTQTKTLWIKDLLWQHLFRKRRLMASWLHCFSRNIEYGGGRPWKEAIHSLPGNQEAKRINREGLDQGRPFTGLTPVTSSF